VNAPLATPALVWRPGVPGCRRRTHPIAGVVWHWTASDNGARSVMRTLKRRGLSIHYVIDYDGTITCMADPATTACMHAGARANRRFIGVEVVNRALVPASKRRPRPVTKGTAHGQTKDRTDFTPAQYEAILRLADELSARFNIPRSTAQGSTVLPHFERFQGHMEHIHISPRKIDCGGLVMSALRAHGYA
jgi:N-acetyl-anhydromuramyl-L-alanine amidase AmpD